MHASTPLILRKSRMRRRARTDLCGGRSAMVVPTATTIRTRRRLLGEWNFHSDLADFERMPVEDATPNESCFKVSAYGGTPRGLVPRLGRGQSTVPTQKKNPLERGRWDKSTQTLAVAGDRTHLPRQEMVRRPRTGHDHLAVFELLGGSAVTVLIFFDGLGVDEVSDIEQHSVGIDLLAADFFLQRIEELVHLDGEGAGFGLAFALPRCLLAKLGQVLAANRIGQNNLFHGAAKRTVPDRQLDAHFGLAAKPLHALTESAAVGTNGLADGIFGVENRSEAEGQDSGGSEAPADHAGMLQNGFFIEVGGR